MIDSSHVIAHQAMYSSWLEQVDGLTRQAAKPTAQLWQSSLSAIAREASTSPHWTHASEVSLSAKRRTHINACSF